MKRRTLQPCVALASLHQAPFSCRSGEEPPSCLSSERVSGHFKQRSMRQGQQQRQVDIASCIPDPIHSAHNQQSESFEPLDSGYMHACMWSSLDRQHRNSASVPQDAIMCVVKHGQAAHTSRQRLDRSKKLLSPMAPRCTPKRMLNYYPHKTLNNRVHRCVGPSQSHRATDNLGFAAIDHTHRDPLSRSPSGITITTVG